MHEEIQKKFDETSRNYDDQRKKLIPCFKDFYSIATSIAESNLDCPRILDIGAGTGIFSEYIFNRYPKAEITLIDISEKMLELSKLRFKDSTNVKYIVDDYTTYIFHENYDIIISSLSIHHLFDDEKLELYKKCYSLLNLNGIFINSDQFLGETPYVEDLNKRLWKKSVENSDLTKEEISSCYERIKLDKEATIQQQVDWLKEAGFTDVNCSYKYYHFAIISGRKMPFQNDSIKKADIFE